MSAAEKLCTNITITKHINFTETPQNIFVLFSVGKQRDETATSTDSFNFNTETRRLFFCSTTEKDCAAEQPAAAAQQCAAYCCGGKKILKFAQQLFYYTYVPGINAVQFLIVMVILQFSF